LLVASLLPVKLLRLIKLPLYRHLLIRLLHHKILLLIEFLLRISLVVILLLLIHHIHIPLIILRHRIRVTKTIWSCIIEELFCSSSLSKIIIIVATELLVHGEFWMPVSAVKRVVCVLFLVLFSFAFEISLHGFDADFSEELDEFLAFLLFKLNSEFGSREGGYVGEGWKWLTYFYLL